MQCNILINFAFAAVVIGAIAVTMYIMHGSAGMALYLAFAAVCLTPAILNARSILKGEKGGSL